MLSVPYVSIEFIDVDRSVVPMAIPILGGPRDELANACECMAYDDSLDSDVYTLVGELVWQVSA